MAKLIWTLQAKSDLRNIGEYISTNSPFHAKATIRKLYNTVQLLRKHPFIGRIVPEKRQKNIRELLEGKYRIIYEVREQKDIIILTIHHSSRNLKTKAI